MNGEINSRVREMLNLVAKINIQCRPKLKVVCSDLYRNKVDSFIDDEFSCDQKATIATRLNH